MTKPRINPAAIGLFIAGAIVILFASIVLFGSGKFFRQTKEFLLTFREPVTGLEVGAPVKLMGVTVGNVKEVAIRTERAQTNALLINVVIEVDRANPRLTSQNRPMDLDDRVRFEGALEAGLRGRLEVLSMLSGQLYVALDLFPGEAGFELDQEKQHGYWQIPTLPSTKRQLMQSVVTSLENFTRFDFQGTSVELKELLREVRSDLAGLELDQIGTNLVQTLSEARDLLAAPELRGAVTNLDTLLGNLDRVTGRLDAQLDPILTQAQVDLKQAGQAFQEATGTLQALREQVAPGSTLSRELIRTLEESRAALNSLRQLAQALERNPSSLLTGKKPSNP